MSNIQTVLTIYEAFGRGDVQTILGHLTVAIIGLEFMVKSTVHTVKEEDEVHIWRFDDRGKVASFCHKVDSHQHWLALQPA